MPFSSSFRLDRLIWIEKTRVAKKRYLNESNRLDGWNSAMVTKIRVRAVISKLACLVSLFGAISIIGSSVLLIKEFRSISF